MAKPYAKKFYKSKEWQGIRKSILMRDKYICQVCGKPAEEVHHIDMVTPSNIDMVATHKAENLISLCRDCHMDIHRDNRINGVINRNRENVPEVAEGFGFDENGFVIELIGK